MSPAKWTNERIPAPGAFSTRPFLFRRGKRHENVFHHFPWPDLCHGDGLIEKCRPIDRFTLVYDQKLGWCACHEMLFPGKFFDQYEEVAADWFQDLKPAVAFLRKIHEAIERQNRLREALNN